jgi:hypothetical protein
MDKEILRLKIRLAYIVFGLASGVIGFIWLLHLMGWKITSAIMLLFLSESINGNLRKGKI